MATRSTGTAWQFVDASWLLPGVLSSAVGYRATDAAPAIHRGLPAPSLTFIISLGDPIISGWSAEQAAGADAWRNDILVGGMHTSPAYIAQTRVQAGIQVAVRPLAARRLFGVRAGDLDAAVIDGTAVLGSAVAELRERLGEAASWSDGFALLERYLSQRCLRSENEPRPRTEIIEAWNWIARHGGTGSIAGVAQHVALSQRQLRTLFRAEFGITPKEVSRLIRFQRARNRISRSSAAGTPLDLATVAHTCGYYDQSHLVSDFQQHVGTSPTQWVAEERRNIQAADRPSGEDSAA